MALERVPGRHPRPGRRRPDGADPAKIEEIQEAVTIPVMAKARIGHFAEAQVLQALEVDYIDESEVLTPADEHNHIDKFAFEMPFVCGATNLGEALRRIGEGAAMIRSKGEAGTGNIVEAVRHMREITTGIKRLCQPRPRGARRAPRRSSERRSRWCARSPPRGWLPVPLFCAGGIATPADAALMMQLGRRGQLRRLGDLQERRSRAPRPRDRRGDDPLRGPAARRRRDRPSSARRCRASRSRRWPPQTR